jgi:hypothetical protein
MLPELLIGLFVLLLSAYWFRYNCQAILKTRTSRERACQVAAANELKFVEAAETLDRDVAGEQLQTLHRCLQRDYIVLTSLLRYSSTLPTPGFTVDERLLMADFRLLEAWYEIVHRFAARRARRTLRERARILVHFANRMADRSSSILRA